MDDVVSKASAEASGHTITHRSARSRGMEIITRGERRRRWTLEQKQAIVLESLGPDLTPTEVARKHGIGSGQLYTWRQQFVKLQGLSSGRNLRFAKVDVAEASPAVVALPETSVLQSPAAVPAKLRPGGIIEIVLPGGVVLRVDASVDGDALRRVMDALSRR